MIPIEKFKYEGFAITPNGFRITTLEETKQKLLVAVGLKTQDVMVGGWDFPTFWEEVCKVRGQYD